MFNRRFEEIAKIGICLDQVTCNEFNRAMDAASPGDGIPRYRHSRKVDDLGLPSPNPETSVDNKRMLANQQTRNTR